MHLVIIKMLGSMLMKLVTQQFIKEMFIMAAELAAKSSKTTFDDKLVESIKKALDK